MPPPKDNQGGRFPSTYGVYGGGSKFTGALHASHEPAGWWRKSPEHDFICELCHPPALERLVHERRPGPNE